MTEVIEGTAVEIVPEVRAVAVVQQPGQAIVATVADPAAMVDVASRLATVLRDIVERQKLYAVIQGKKYPQVEAWMTIARLDNVVAREPAPPLRHDDGSYEAFAELIRLSDGMVIGSSSALCGTPDDSPWGKRPEPARRSMAQTRATSRAFRQQYSWIMALAGYEPTPAEEMPRDDDSRPSGAPASPPQAGAPASLEPFRGNEDGPWEGAATTGQPPTDGSLRQTPDGPVFGFVVMEPVEGKANPRKLQVLARGDLAFALEIAWKAGAPDHATVWGEMWMQPWEKDGAPKPPYRRIIAERVMTPDWTLPAADGAKAAPVDSGKVADLSDLPF
jgi:hypothetical protein